MRRHLSHYFKGLPNFKEYRNLLPVLTPMKFILYSINCLPFMIDLLFKGNFGLKACVFDNFHHRELPEFHYFCPKLLIMYKVEDFEEISLIMIMK